MALGPLNHCRVADGPGRIVWLASYPKSGNTWMRIVLGNLLGVASPDGDINEQASEDGIASCRLDFDDIVGVNAAELGADQVDRLRPRVYEQLSDETDRLLFLKIHDAYTNTPAGEPMIPLRATRGVVHIVRNPLDVVISLAHHHGADLPATLNFFSDDEASIGASDHRWSEQLRQRLLDWSSHTASWLNAPLPRLTVRYEDMLGQPYEVFAAVARFCGLDSESARLNKAVDAGRFERLRELESQGRFKETPRHGKKFFREGKAGGWQDVLTPEQVALVVSRHGATMRLLGYGGGES